MLELRGITKRVPGASSPTTHVDLDLRAGEVHALLGENGAGKSTLMNVLYGLLPPDEGEILRRRRAASRIALAADAIALGIGMVHQHFMLIPVMTVAENIVLGGEPRRGLGCSTWRGRRERVRELSERYGLAVDPEARVEDIAVGMQQRVEILKALYRDASVLILDEPTAVLTPQEADELFARAARAARRAARRSSSSPTSSTRCWRSRTAITVLRRGKKVATVDRRGRHRARAWPS